MSLNVIFLAGIYPAKAGQSPFKSYYGQSTTQTKVSNSESKSCLF